MTRDEVELKLQRRDSLTDAEKKEIVAAIVNDPHMNRIAATGALLQDNMPLAYAFMIGKVNVQL